MELKVMSAAELRTMVQDEPLPRLVRDAAPALWRLVADDDTDPSDLWRDARDTAGETLGDLTRDAAEAASEARDAALEHAVDSALESARENASDLGQDAIEAAEKIAEGDG